MRRMKLVMVTRIHLTGTVVRNHAIKTFLCTFWVCINWDVFLLQIHFVLFRWFRIPDNAGYTESNYDRIRGEDRWIGRSVKKNFEGHGIFTGIIDAVDDQEGHNGHRVFHIVYADGDDEWIGVDEVVEIILPPDDDATTAEPVSMHVNVYHLQHGCVIYIFCLFFLPWIVLCH